MMKNGGEKKKDKRLLLPEGPYLSPAVYPVYPQIDDFDVLDLSDYKTEELQFIRQFLLSIENKQLDKSIFVEKNYYNYVILNYEIADWPEIQKYYIGKAYKGAVSKTEDIFEIAVRLMFERSYVDLIINLDKIDNKCLINQVRVSEFKDR
jgi:hypothetical protein